MRPLPIGASEDHAVEVARAMSAVLVVDDSLTVRMDLVEALEAAGLRSVGCATLAERAQRSAPKRSRSRSSMFGSRTVTASSSSRSCARRRATPSYRS